MQVPEPPEPSEPLDTLEGGAVADPVPGLPRRRAVTAALAVLALLAAGATGAAVAGSGTDGAPSARSAASSSASAAAGPGRQVVPYSYGSTQRQPARGALGEAVAGALHARFVAPDPQGGYRTMVVHRGTATRVSIGSIRVTSADGFARTYVITAATEVCEAASVSAIATGAEVDVLAVKADGRFRAVHLANRSGSRSAAGPTGAGPAGSAG